MKNALKPVSVILGSVIALIMAKYKWVALGLVFLVFCMIFEQISWFRVINMLRKENKSMDGKKKIFKNPLHGNKVDTWLIIGMIIAVEVVACLRTGVECYLVATCTTMMYYSLINISSFCVNTRFRNNDKVLALLQVVSDKLITAFGVGIDIVEDKAVELISAEKVENLVDKIVNEKIGVVRNENKKDSGR